VLPFHNLSGDPSQDYFADGMTELLIGNRGKIESLKVISRTSVMRFKNAELSLPEIAAALSSPRFNLPSERLLTLNGILPKPRRAFAGPSSLRRATQNLGSLFQTFG